MAFIPQQVFDHAADYRNREDEQIEVQFMAECLYDLGRGMGMETTEEYLKRRFYGRKNGRIYGLGPRR